MDLKIETRKKCRYIRYSQVNITVLCLVEIFLFSCLRFYFRFSHEGSDTPPNSSDIKVLISSLRSHVLKLRVAKKPGKQGMDLLSDSNESSGGIWNSITRHLNIFFIIN